MSIYLWALGALLYTGGVRRFLPTESAETSGRRRW